MSARLLTFVFSDCFLVAFGRGARQDADPKRLLEAALIQRLVSEWSSHPRWRPAVDLKWAIHDLCNVPAEGIMNTTPVMSPENQRRIDYLFDTEGFDLPNEVRPDCHKDGHTYGSVYGRLRWDKPSQTITTGFLTPGRGRYIHPENRRVLTPHEAARIQVFPDSFKFAVPNAPVPSRARLTKWIGDAVPSVMGYAAALCAVTSMYPPKDK